MPYCSKDTPILMVHSPKTCARPVQTNHLGRRWNDGCNRKHRRSTWMCRTGVILDGHKLIYFPKSHIYIYIYVYIVCIYNIYIYDILHIHIYIYIIYIYELVNLQKFGLMSLEVWSSWVSLIGHHQASLGYLTIFVVTAPSRIVIQRHNQKKIFQYIYICMYINTCIYTYNSHR